MYTRKWLVLLRKARERLSELYPSLSITSIKIGAHWKTTSKQVKISRSHVILINQFPNSVSILHDLKEARKGFLVAIVFVKRWKIPKKDISWCRQTINIFATLLWGNTLRALMTSYRLPRQQARSTKRRSKLQLLKITGKTKSVTYRFLFLCWKSPKML